MKKNNGFLQTFFEYSSDELGTGNIPHEKI
jgi:hypothetical protein